MSFCDQPLIQLYKTDGNVPVCPFQGKIKLIYMETIWLHCPQITLRVKTLGLFAPIRQKLLI